MRDPSLFCLHQQTNTLIPGFVVLHLTHPEHLPGCQAPKALLLECPRGSSKNFNHELCYLPRGSEASKTAVPLQRRYLFAQLPH